MEIKCRRPLTKYFAITAISIKVTPVSAYNWTGQVTRQLFPGPVPSIMASRQMNPLTFNVVRWRQWQPMKDAGCCSLTIPVLFFWAGEIKIFFPRGRRSKRVRSFQTVSASFVSHSASFQKKQFWLCMNVRQERDRKKSNPRPIPA